MTTTKQAHTPTPEQIAAVRRLQTYDRLREQNARLVAALRVIAGYEQPADNLLSSADIARALLAAIDKGE